MKLVLSLCLAGLMTNALVAAIVVNPTALNLGTVDRNSGAAGSVKVTNTFSSATTFSVSFSAQSGNFSVSTAPLNLAVNQQGSIAVNIEAGSSPGNYSGTITIQGGGATVSVPVTGTVIDALATTFSPNIIDFGPVELGQSKFLNLNITNKSPGSLTYSATVNPSLYLVLSPASLPLSSNQSGVLTVRFGPVTNVGSIPGSLDLRANNVIVGSVSLKAISVAPPGSIQVTPASLDFGNVDRGSGAASSYTLKNASTATLPLSFTRTGNFVTSTSALSLGAGQSKTIAVNVGAGVPVGPLTGTISISGGGQSATVNLTANVVDKFATTVNPLTLDFGTLNAGETKSLSFTIQNTSLGPLNYTPQTTTSLYSVSPSPLHLESNQSGTFTVNFNPGTATGSLPGSVGLTVTSGTSNQNGPTVTLKASVIPPPKPDLTVSFISRRPTLNTAHGGTQATLTLQVQNVGAANAGSFVLKIFLDNNLMNTAGISVLSATGSVNIDLGFTVPANTTGAHTVKVQVDANNQISESNENNNTVSASMTF